MRVFQYMFMFVRAQGVRFTEIIARALSSHATHELKLDLKSRALRVPRWRECDDMQWCIVYAPFTPTSVSARSNKQKAVI